MGNYFLSKVSERENKTEQRCADLEKEVDELKKIIKKEGMKTSKHKFFLGLLGFLCITLFAVLWVSSNEKIRILKVRIKDLKLKEMRQEKNLEITKTQLEGRIEILQKMVTQQEKRMDILEETKMIQRIPIRAETETKQWGTEELEGFQTSDDSFDKVRTKVPNKTQAKMLEPEKFQASSNSFDKCENVRIPDEQEASGEFQTSGDFMDVLNMWLGGKSMRLIYNASVDGFSVESFHRKCDGKGATVTVITSSEGYVFGGYAAVPWGSSLGHSRGDEYVEDYSGESFVFSLKNPRNSKPEIFPLLNKARAIRNNPIYGPWFGADAIVCMDHSNINGFSYTDLDDGVYMKGVSLEGDKVFTGKRRFRAKEMQVYQVL